MVVGKVTFEKEGCFRWTIVNFVKWLRHKNFQLLRSPMFTFLGAEYCIIARRDSEDLLHASVIRGGDPNCVHVAVWLNTSHTVKYTTEKRSATMCKYTRKTSLRFYMDFSFPLYFWTPTDKSLTVFCELRRLGEGEEPPELQEKFPSEEFEDSDDSDEEEADSVCKSEEVKEEVENSDQEETDSEYKRLKKLQKDFENLLKSVEDCDITIKVQNKEFPAHRIILRARSPVFMSMFSHETQEKISGVVVIEDCDPETFPDFLYYLYSGSTHHINKENVCQLFTASDKYHVDELKEECAKFMKKHLSVETFCDFISLALMHAEQELIDSATEFFCANTVEIVKNAKWQMFLKENSTAGNELFLKSLSR